MSKTQNQQILTALNKGAKLTPLSALTRFGCFRLASRCFELREQGHDIKKTMVTRAGKTFAEYSL